LKSQGRKKGERNNGIFFIEERIKSFEGVPFFFVPFFLFFSFNPGREGGGGAIELMYIIYLSHLPPHPIQPMHAFSRSSEENKKIN